MSYSAVTTSAKRLVRSLGLMPMMTAANNFRCLILKKWAIYNGKNPLEAVYDDTFFDLGHHEFVLQDTPKILAGAISERYHPQSVVDFGCGCAMYLAEFEKCGADVLGIDGSPAASRNLAIEKEKFLLQDLTERFTLPKKYDCAICFEVAEHIPTNTSATLVENITSVSDFIVFTAAHEGQGGHDHINEQPPEFWIDLFAQKNFLFLKEETAEMQKILADQKAIFWLVENILLFRRHSFESSSQK